MVRLDLLGGVALTVDGEPVSGRAAQRHRLALLAILGTARSQPVSRQKLAAYLWPEAGDRARHLLSNSVHLLRKALGDDAIPGTTDALWLNPTVVQCDAQRFEAALASGDLAAAVALYRGPFLDGFFLADTPEFEAWLDGERDRYARLYGQALETLATEQEALQEFRAAAEWWRRLHAVDPVDPRTVLRLMRALEAAGDVDHAIRCARAYEAHVRGELDLEPDRAVVRFAERLVRERGREGDVAAEAATEPVVATRTPAAAPAEAARGTIAPAAASPVAASPAPSALARRSSVLRRHPRLAAAGAAVLATLVILGIERVGPDLARSSSGSPMASAAEPSIAVLPLRSLGTDPRSASLADGMTEELIAVLGRGAGMRVIASTSVRSVTDEEEDVRRIGSLLGVSNVLEGSLQRDEGRVRVQIRLVDVSDGVARWSETYDRELTGVFELQDAIARSVARELDVRLVAGRTLSRRHTRNVAAYELYLSGIDKKVLRSDSTARAALDRLNQAVALDSNYAAAWAGVARLNVRLLQTATDSARRTRIAHAEHAAVRAIELDDSLADAHATLAGVRMMNFDMKGAEPELLRAVALEPATAHFREMLVALYIVTGRPAEALAAAENAVRLEPLSPTAHAELGRALLVLGRCDEALSRLDAILDLEPPLLRAPIIAAQCYIQKRMWPEAIAQLESIAANRGPHGDAMFGYVLERAGRQEEALRIRESLLDGWRRGGVDAAAIALSYLGSGDVDEALTWLDRGASERRLYLAPGLTTMMEPLFAELRHDPRFHDIARRIGLQNR